MERTLVMEKIVKSSSVVDEARAAFRLGTNRNLALVLSWNACM